MNYIIFIKTHNKKCPLVLPRSFGPYHIFKSAVTALKQQGAHLAGLGIDIACPEQLQNRVEVAV